MKPSGRVTGGTSGTINTHESPPVLLGQNCQDLQQIKRLVLETKLYNRKKQEQIYARQVEAKAKWLKTQIKVCLICDNKFFTDDYERLACSIECYIELKRGK